MSDDILPIGMAEMNRIFEVIDDLEISREAIQVDLLRAGDGSIESLSTGKIRIVLPESIALDAWIPQLRSRLEALGDAAEDGS